MHPHSVFPEPRGVVGWVLFKADPETKSQVVCLGGDPRKHGDGVGT